jgi:hypothetical protein
MIRAVKTGALKRLFGPAPRCWICQRPAQAVDHLHPRSLGGVDTPANLRPICNVCNSGKGAKWFGQEHLSHLSQHVRDAAWKAQKSRLGLLYLSEEEGHSLAVSAKQLKVRLEGLFSIKELEAIKKQALQSAGKGRSVGGRPRSRNLVVEANGSRGFILARDEAHLAAVQEARRTRKEYAQRLHAEGKFRPAGCEVCRTLSTLRKDGGRTPLYPLPPNGDYSSSAVVWMCKRCWDKGPRGRARPD